MVSSVAQKIRDWLSSITVSAVSACSKESDRYEILAWLAVTREVVADDSLSKAEKSRQIYRLISFKKTIGMFFNGIAEAVKNYKNSDLPTPVKIAIPVTLGASAIIGSQGAGIAAFGSAIGLPVLVLIFLGSAGITSILEAFLTKPEARDYIGVIMGLIARDEVLRRSKQSLRDAMQAEPIQPQSAKTPEEQAALVAMLQSMNPFEFERHVMSFFQNHGLLAWVTKKSNDAGVDGFARHPDGLIVVQCKRNAEHNPVGRPVVQQIKGVIEENDALRGYIVTTSRFTDQARESALQNDKLVLVDIDLLIDWHLGDGFQL